MEQEAWSAGKSWCAVYLRSGTHNHPIHGRGSAPSVERILAMATSVASLMKRSDSHLRMIAMRSPTTADSARATWRKSRQNTHSYFFCRPFGSSASATMRFQIPLSCQEPRRRRLRLCSGAKWKTHGACRLQRLGLNANLMALPKHDRRSHESADCHPVNGILRGGLVLDSVFLGAERTLRSSPQENRADPRGVSREGESSLLPFRGSRAANSAQNPREVGFASTNC